MGIERNEVRQTYLSTQYTIGIIDSMVEMCNHIYDSLKYWYTMKRHVDVFAVIVVYEFYKECVAEQLALQVFEMENEILQVMDFYLFKS